MDKSKFFLSFKFKQMWIDVKEIVTNKHAKIGAFRESPKAAVGVASRTRDRMSSC